MQAADPLADAEYRDRLVKLLAMLGTDHAGEAEAARGKLLDHLRARGLSLNDVGEKLDPNRGRPDPGAVERLRRSLAASEQRRLQAERIAQDAMQEARRVTRVAHLAQAEAASLRERYHRSWLMAVAGIGIAAGFMLAAVIALLRGPGGWDRAAISAPAAQRDALYPGEDLSQWQRGRITQADQHEGVILEDGVPLLVQPSADAPLLASLPRGTVVTILHGFRSRGTVWALVRSGWGAGYIAGTSVAVVR